MAAIEDDDVYEDDDEEVDAPPLEVVEESTPPPTGISRDAIYPEGLPGVDTVFVFPNNVQRREFQGGCSVLLFIGLLSNASPMPECSALAVLCFCSSDAMAICQLLLRELPFLDG